MNGENKEPEKIDRMAHVAEQDPQDFYEVAALLEPEFIYNPIVNRSLKPIRHPSGHVTIKGALMVAVIQLSGAMRILQKDLEKRMMNDFNCTYPTVPPADCTDGKEDDDQQ